MLPLTLPAPRTTIRAQVRLHPLLAFLLLAFPTSWLLASLDAYFDLGALSGFHILFGALPALAASIVAAVIDPTPSGVPARSRWRLFAVLAGALMALFVVQRIWSAAGLISVHVGPPRPLVYPGVLAFLMDLLAAAALAWTLSGVRSAQRGVRDFLRSLDPRRQPLCWQGCLVAAGLYPLVVLLGNGLAHALGYGLPAPRVSGPWLWLALDVLLAFLVVMIGAGGMEEPGWRGLAVPLLQRSFSPIVASLILGVIWTLWHLPLYFFGVFKGGLSLAFLSALVVIPLAVLLSAVYNLTGGSLPAVILLHTSFNVTSTFLPVSTIASELWLFLMLVVGVWMWRWPRTFGSSHPRPKRCSLGAQDDLDFPPR